MLISVTLENWMSFKEATELSMVAGREQRFGEKCHPVKKYNMRLLPITAIYGGNASGKSNFLRGIDFATDVIKGRYRNNDTLPVKRFKLDEVSKSKPSVFAFEVLASGKFYRYSFSATDKEITHEILIERSSMGKENIIFEFEHGLSVAPYNFELGQIETSKNKDTGEIQYLAKDREQSVIDELAIAKNPTQLFLNKLAQRKIKALNHINRALSSIDVIMTNMGLWPDDTSDTNYYEAAGKLLSDMDTGISSIHLDDVPDQQWKDIFSDPETSENFKKIVLERMEEIPVGFSMPLPRNFFVLKSEEGITLKHLRSVHKGVSGADVAFEIEEESDGTQRLLELLPAYIPLLTGEDSKTIFIDELDRSFHNQLTRTLLERYLESCNSETQKQLIFTTHNLEIMDTELLRRDELWFTERKYDGNSILTSLAEFTNVRSTNDIRKLYQQGRFGGIPNII